MSEQVKGYRLESVEASMQVALDLRKGTPTVDSIKGQTRLVRTPDDERDCPECGCEEATGYGFCDDSRDYYNDNYGDDPINRICCWCDDCDGCFWACPECGHGSGRL
jgi:hypothetical protein